MVWQKFLLAVCGHMACVGCPNGNYTEHCFNPEEDRKCKIGSMFRTSTKHKERQQHIADASELDKDQLTIDSHLVKERRELIPNSRKFKLQNLLVSL